MTSTDPKVSDLPDGKNSDSYSDWTPEHAARCVEEALGVLEGRWKMMIVFHLFTHPVLRFSELERAIPGVSQKMLIQQLRELERDGMVCREVYPEVPPRVEYALTDWGRSLCPVLDMLLQWREQRPISWSG